ncbi:transposase [Arthrobacter sp. 1P04AC-2]
MPWELALEMLDELSVWGLVPPLVVADAVYGEINALRLGLQQRDTPYVLAVKATTSVHPAGAVPEPIECSGRGPHLQLCSARPGTRNRPRTAGPGRH